MFFINFINKFNIDIQVTHVIDPVSIDFLIWPGSLDEFMFFINFINKFNIDIQVTYVIDPVSIDFLDITVFGPVPLAMAVGPMLLCLYRISLLREVPRLFSSLGLGGSAVVSWITPPEITRLVLLSGTVMVIVCVAPG